MEDNILKIRIIRKKDQAMIYKISIFHKKRYPKIWMKVCREWLLHVLFPIFAARKAKVESLK
jgi:hypothetical protein